MTRTKYLAIVTVLGVVLTVTNYEARQERSDLALHEVGTNLYMLANAPSVEGMGGGGNTAIFVTGSGVTLVDTKISGYGPDIMDYVQQITDEPVTTIINTHTHWDHSGSNVSFPDTVNFVAHENTAGHMASTDCDDGAGYQGGSIKNCGAFKGENEKYLPNTTFSTRTTLFSGADQIDLYYFGRGHTDGDTFVVFKNARTMHTGDMFARKGLPYLDVANTNGSAIEFGATLEKAIAGIPDVDTIIPGHASTTLLWSDLENYSGFYNDILQTAREGRTAGRSVTDIVGSYTVPNQYQDFVVTEQRLRDTVQHVFDGN